MYIAFKNGKDFLGPGNLNLPHSLDVWIEF